MSKHKIVPFPQTPFEEFLDKQKQLYREDSLTDFICISRRRYRKGEEVDGQSAELMHYWFGEDSTVMCVGLLEIMKQMIISYMQEFC